MTLCDTMVNFHSSKPTLPAQVRADNNIPLSLGLPVPVVNLPAELYQVVNRSLVHKSQVVE